ncbi:hypothetical protein [Nitrosopumilus sp. K4]|uniref:hypothetical protein n=1 Tax=Nitrosopumilus sp. K4 TaxID=2795383 RepID=UPI002011FA0A|nr:hypothetical protein [Nitrosopumilus sp. K4]
MSFAILLIPIGTSFGATQTELGDDIFVFVQTTVRNSDGTLLVYLESTKFTDLNMSALESFLNFEASRGNDPVITIDGEKFQVIRRVQSQEFDSDGLVASTILSDVVDGKPTVLARFAHDGYTVESGDTLESMWTFVRPVA